MRTKQSYIDMGKLGAKIRWDNEPSADVRFWKNVKKGSPDECWPWMRSIGNTGYGKWKWKNKSIGSHRVAWMLINGEIPPRMCICHKCDNPPCCNPNHLFLGTYSDNAIDMLNKGRMDLVKKSAIAKIKNLRGEKHARSKFTNDQAKAIKEAVKNGVRKASLARQFNVAPTTIGRLVSGQTWNHIQ